ncbi:MAG TPA: DUF952 domain-containing protein [Steroidobacteraceae bacterium]|jgi:uncharacterized protein (DUF952 family)
MRIVLHIAHRDMWEASAPVGYYKPLSLDSDGFIHCSTIEQTVETANQFFTGQEGLILLCSDTDKLEAEIKYEAAACIGDQGAWSFPHIYGPLNVSAVAQVVEFPPRADGTFELPPQISR